MELSEAQTLERNQAIRQLTQTKGWKILEDHWRKLLQHRKADQSNNLRSGKYHEATLMQGQVDGIESILGGVEKVLNGSQEENPNY